MSHLAAQQRLTQHCKSTPLQLKKKIKANSFLILGPEWKLFSKSQQASLCANRDPGSTCSEAWASNEKTREALAQCLAYNRVQFRVAESAYFFPIQDYANTFLFEVAQEK